MDLNAIITLASLAIFAVIVTTLYLKARKQTYKISKEEITSVEKVVEIVKQEVVAILKDDYSLSIPDDEFDKLYKRKARLAEALKNCVYGVDSAKILVKDLVRTIIAERVPIDTVRRIIGLDEDSEPSSQVKFEIIMHMYKKVHGKKALVAWIDDYDLRRERQATDAKSKYDVGYYITTEDLNDSYYDKNYKISDDDCLSVLATLVFQQYKGFGVVDTVREMDIDGLNMGTSGNILDVNKINKQEQYDATRAVWLYDRGRYIHLRFICFGSEEELRRIIQLIVRWGNTPVLTAKRGYIVATMYDKSRVLALRPPAAEYWACFIRKFTLPDVSLQALIKKSYTHNAELPIAMLEMLMRGQVSCAITGRQGSGKTTLLSSVMAFIDPRYTLRILEMSPELFLRELYPSRNILSVQETATVTASELQDALKKSDGSVSICGEVATDSVAARMIQFGRVASLFTVFTHHAKTAKSLVTALSNSLMAAGGFDNNTVAEHQVLDVVKVDVHMEASADGKRYIDRITEIVTLEEGIDYPEYDNRDGDNSINAITREYYQRTTDRVGFITRDIIKYDFDTHTYKPVNRFSGELEDYMRRMMPKAIRDRFDLIMLQNYGAKDDEKVEEKEIELEAEIDKTSQEFDKIIANTGSTEDAFEEAWNGAMSEINGAYSAAAMFGEDIYSQEEK